MKKLLLLIYFSISSILLFGITKESLLDIKKKAKINFALATEPDISVTGLDSVSRQPDKIEIGWDSQTTTNTSGYIILYQEGPTPPVAADELTDGTAYNDDLSTGVSAIEITLNTTDNQEIDPLNDITEYSFSVIPFNITGGDVTTINYKTTDPATISIFTIATEPTASIATLTLENKTTTTAEFSIPQYPFVDNGGYILYAEPGTSPRNISTLEDGVSAIDQSTLFGPFYDIEIDETITDLSVSGLEQATQYTANVINYNSNGNFQTVNYKITSPPSVTFWTLSDPPSDPADGATFLFSNETDNTVELDWDNVANTDKYLILYAQNQADLDINDVEDGIAPGSLSFPSGVDFAIAPSNDVSLSGLQASTEYTYYVIPYNEGDDPTTINYKTEPGPGQGTFTTNCAPPDAQADFDPAANITSSSVDLSWDAVTGTSVKYLVVAKEGAAVNLNVNNGDDYESAANSNFADVNNEVANDNNIIYSGTGTSITVSGLLSTTTYHFAIYAYEASDFCYSQDAAGVLDIETLAPAASNTLSLNSATVTIDSKANDVDGTFITVMNFNMIDTPDADESPSKLSGFTFTPGNNDYFDSNNIDWDDIIAEARVQNTTATGNNFEEATVNASNIEIAIGNGNNNNTGQFGFIAKDGDVNMRLQIKLRKDITMANIDNKRFVFELNPSSIIVQDGSEFETGAGIEITTGDEDNVIEVVATTFNFLEPSMAVGVNATEVFATAPEVEVTDGNGNLDLDYVNGYSLTNADGIGVNNPPGDFSNGVLNFPSNFNYQGSGEGTLSIVDATNSIAIANSNTITVNPKISFSEITEPFNNAELESGESNEVVLGFDLTALSSATLEEFIVDVDQTLADRVSNVRLFSSSDNIFDVADSEVEVGNIDDGANKITFSGLLEVINETPSNYFVVVEVDESVSASDPDVTFSFNVTNFSFVGDYKIEANSIAETYSFEDVLAPEVVSITAQPVSLADADASPGDDAFQISIEYNEEMDTDPTKEPVITFPSDNLSSSLSPSSSSWDVDRLIYTAVYDFSDAGVTIKNIDTRVESAEDLSGNTQIQYDEAALFSVDTENPLVTLSLNRGLVNEPNNTIILTAEFSEVMDTGNDPDFIISEASNFDAGVGSWDVNQTEYSITFTHDKTEEFQEDVFITISNALDTAGNNITTTNSDFFDINTVRSKIEGITSTNAPDTYKEGDGPIEITIDFNENVSIGGTGNPQLMLNADASAVASFSSIADDKITFTYTISDGDNANPLEVLSLDLNGAIITNNDDNPADLDLQGNALSDDKSIVIDTESPTIASITSNTANGTYGPGEEINIKVIFSEPIQQTGTAPSLTLNTGATAVFENITLDNELNFTYTVGPLGDGENTNDLAVTAISSSENQILDIVGNPSDLTLNAGNNTLNTNKTIVIDTEAPSLDSDPFSPANGSLNVSLSETFSITLDEPVSGAGSDNIKLIDATNGTVLATLDGSAAFANTEATTLNFNSLSSILQESTEYYFEFDEGAIEDIAENPLAAFTGNSNWSFTSFGPARIDNFSVAACVGEIFTIEGQYFTGVSEILTDVESGSPYEIATFSVEDDNTISFTVPNGTVPGKITLNKKNGEDGNTDNASTTSLSAIKVGPSSGQIVLVNSGTDVVCNLPGSDPAPVETSIRFDIIGGSGVYEIEYTDGVSNFVESNYNSGDEVIVNPPNTGNNTYSIVSIRDEDPDLNSCIAADNGTDLTITEFEQSEVEAGGSLDAELGVSTVSVCLAEEDEVDFSDAGLLGTLPEINGDITTGEWTIVDGPSGNGGGFSSDFSSKTSTSLTPTYYPSLADASYGSVTLRLTSDDPSAPNPCSRDFDEITIVFANTVSVNIGSDLNTCIETDDLGNESAIQALNATLGGGAQSLEWSRDDQYGEQASYDGTWGFAASSDATNFSLTTTIEDPFYKASPEEIINGLAIVSAVPTGGGCGGGSAQSREINIFINELPDPTRSLDPTEVCSSEEGVRYRMSPSSTQSTFKWKLTNEGPDTAGQNDKNQIDGLRTGNILVVNFREVSTETKDTLIVQEINPNTGCESIPDSIFITIKPLPEANITYTGNTTVSQGDGRILLTGEGGQAGNIQSGGVFSGPGIVTDQAGNYYLEPSILNVTDISDPSDDIIINLTYTDNFTCSASDFIRFNVYAANSSFQNLQSQYCVTDEPDTIFVTPGITGDDFEVIGIGGPGITAIGLEDADVDGSVVQVFKAIFDPGLAYEQNISATDPSDIDISFTQREISNPSNITTVSQAQTVRANPLPQLEFDGPEYDFCTYDEPTDLEAAGSNNLNTYEFILLNDSLPAKLLDGNSSIGFEFDPAPLDNYLDSLGKESIEIFMEYRYTNASGCSASDSLSFFVYKQPNQPQLDNEDLCNLNGMIETAVVNNYNGNNPNLELEWYTNSSLSGDPVATGLSFTPTLEFFANSNEVKFYVSRRNINSSGEDEELCSSQPTEITYRALGIPELSWNKSSFGSEDVVFTAIQDERNVESYLWEISRILPSGLEVVETQSITDLENLQKIVDFEEFGAGQYQVEFTVNTSFRCSTSISKKLIILPESSSNEVYSFDFESSNQGWVASIDNNNSWEWAAPGDSSNIQTDGSFWITNADGSYNPGEQSYVYSPVLDISQIEKPVVNFDLWFNVIDNVDGLILEYSTDDLIIEDPNKEWKLLGNFDDGISSGLNWYESTGIRSRPGTDNITPQGIENNNNIFGQGWSKEIEGSIEKLQAKHALSEISQDDLANVIFRFQFKSNTTGFLPDGVAFDNFSIESLNRNVLVEYFGDEENSTDAQEMQSLASAYEASSSLAWINYRIFEEDPLFVRNASAMLSRLYQYEAYEASNQFAIDGEMKNEYSFSTNAGRNDLRNSELVSSSVDMVMSVSKVDDDQLSINLSYTTPTEFSENTRLFVAVLQKEITEGTQGTNPNKTYYNVLREILPKVDGVDISNNTSGQIEVNFTASRESDNEELILVSFIQDVETGEIYQSTNIKDVPLLSYSNVTANNSLETMGLKIYPNPVREKLKMLFGNELSESIRLRVFDLTGKMILEDKLEAGILNYEISTQNLKTGMYNLMITNEKGDHRILKFAVTN